MRRKGNKGMSHRLADFANECDLALTVVYELPVAALAKSSGPVKGLGHCLYHGARRGAARLPGVLQPVEQGVQGTEFYRSPVGNAAAVVGRVEVLVADLVEAVDDQ